MNIHPVAVGMVFRVRAGSALPVDLLVDRVPPARSNLSALFARPACYRSSIADIDGEEGLSVNRGGVA